MIAFLGLVIGVGGYLIDESIPDELDIFMV